MAARQLQVLAVQKSGVWASNYAIKRDLREKSGFKFHIGRVGPLFWLLGIRSNDIVSTSVMRLVLWAGAAYNALIAVLLAFPVAFSTISGLPKAGSIFFPWVLALFVALFGGTYAWLALQPVISRPLIAMSALGKSGAALVAFACLLRGDIPFRTFSATLVDLVFAIAFFTWLRSSSPSNA